HVPLGRGLGPAVRREGHGRVVLAQRPRETLAVDGGARRKDDPRRLRQRSGRLEQRESRRSVLLEVRPRVSHGVGYGRVSGQVEYDIRLACGEQLSEPTTLEVDPLDADALAHQGQV